MKLKLKRISFGKEIYLNQLNVTYINVDDTVSVEYDEETQLVHIKKPPINPKQYIITGLTNVSAMEVDLSEYTDEAGQADIAAFTYKKKQRASRKSIEDKEESWNI